MLRIFLISLLFLGACKREEYEPHPFISGTIVHHKLAAPIGMVDYCVSVRKIGYGYCGISFSIGSNAIWHYYEIKEYVKPDRIRTENE
jgi:hypothetical protein